MADRTGEGLRADQAAAMGAGLKYGEEPEFLENYRKHLEEWSRDIANTNGPIVAISRKGPRLLELLRQHGLLPETVIDRVVSERSLAFWDGTDREVTVLDDMVTYGTTLNAITDRVLALAQHPRDLQLNIMPFAVSAGASAACLARLTRSALVVTEREHSRHLMLEMRALTTMGVPLDIDHPILFIDGVNIDPIACGEALERLAQRFGAVSNRVRPAISALDDRSQGCAWTIALPGPLAGDQASFQKLRVMMDASRSRIALCLMQPRVWTRRGALDILRCEARDSLAEWERHRSARQDPATTWQEESLIVAAHYLFTANLLASLHDEVSSAVEPLGLTSRCYTRRLDTNLIFGTRLGSEIHDTIAVRFVGPAAPRALPEPEPLQGDFDSRWPDLDLAPYRGLLHRAIAHSKTSDDVVHAIFYAQHHAIETVTRQPAHTVSRLSFGISFRHVYDVAVRRLGLVTEAEVHASLDRFVDRGAVVPRYVELEHEAGRAWARLYRVGEIHPTEWAYAVPLLFDPLAKALGPMRTIPALTLEKYLVLALCSELGLSDPRLRSLMDSLGASRCYYRYGPRALVEADGRPTFLVDWALHQNLLRRQMVSGRERNSGRGFARLRTEGVYPPTEAPYGINETEALEDIADLVAILMAPKSVGMDGLVLLTGLMSEEELMLACSAELRIWISAPLASVRAALSEISELVATLRNRENESARDKTRRLYLFRQVTNGPAQAREKLRIWESRPRLLAEIEAAVPQRTNARRALEKILHGVEKREARSRQRTHDTEWMVSLVNIAHEASSVLRTILGHLGEPHSQRYALRDRMQTVKERTANPKYCCGRVRAVIEDELGRTIEVSIDELVAIPNTDQFEIALQTCRWVAAVSRACERILSVIAPGKSEVGWRPVEGVQYVATWDVRRSHQVSAAKLGAMLQAACARIHQLRGKEVIELNHRNPPDSNTLVCASFETVLTAFEELARGLAPHTIRMGCACSQQDRLELDPVTNLHRGEVFAVATRMMNLFEEISRGGETVWKLREKPAQPAGSYLVIDEFAVRHAKARTEWGGFSDQDLKSFKDAYVPRLSHSLQTDVYVYELPGTRPPGAPIDGAANRG